MDLRKYLKDVSEVAKEGIKESFWIQLAQVSVMQDQYRTYNGSVPGKADKIDRYYAGAHVHFVKKYLWSSNVGISGKHSINMKQPDHAFDGHFRMLRPLFSRIFTKAVAHSSNLLKEPLPDAVRRVLSSSLLKVSWAMRHLGDGLHNDLGNRIFDDSEITSALSLSDFCIAVTTAFKGTSLCQLKGADIGESEYPPIRLYTIHHVIEAFKNAICNFVYWGYRLKHTRKDFTKMLAYLQNIKVVQHPENLTRNEEIHKSTEQTTSVRSVGTPSFPVMIPFNGFDQIRRRHLAHHRKLLESLLNVCSIFYFKGSNYCLLHVISGGGEDETHLHFMCVHA